MLLIDDRCNRGECKGVAAYRMTGACSNCRAKNITIFITMGHSASGEFRCPVCGCNTIKTDRLVGGWATDSEISELNIRKVIPEPNLRRLKEMQDERADLIARVENDLTLHPPVAPYIGEGMDALRAKAKEFAYEVIDKGCVPSREASTALTKIEEALFYAIASIARYQSSIEENNAES